MNGLSEQAGRGSRYHMQRVVILGSGGSGKSTLARRLGEATGLPVIHLDAHYWRPGWVETPAGEWEGRVRDLAAGERWIIDGNYSHTLDVRLSAADTIVFLDLPRARCLWRVLSRVVRYAGRTRPDMAAGCPERLEWPFLLWVWNYPVRSRPRVLDAIDRHRGRCAVHVLRSPARVRQFLADARDGAGRKDVPAGGGRAW